MSCTVTTEGWLTPTGIPWSGKCTRSAPRRARGSKTRSSRFRNRDEDLARAERWLARKTPAAIHQQLKVDASLWQRSQRLLQPPDVASNPRPVMPQHPTVPVLHRSYPARRAVGRTRGDQTNECPQQVDKVREADDVMVEQPGGCERGQRSEQRSKLCVVAR